MKIYVEYDGGTFSVDAKAGDSVNDLHTRILLHLGGGSSSPPIGHPEYDLVFAGKVLTETPRSSSSLLSDNSLRHGSIIQLVVAPIRIKVEFEGKVKDITFPNHPDVTVREVKQLVRDAFFDEFSTDLPNLKKDEITLIQDDSSIIYNYQVASRDILVAYRKDLTQYSTTDTSYYSSDTHSSSSSDSPPPPSSHIPSSSSFVPHSSSSSDSPLASSSHIPSSSSFVPPSLAPSSPTFSRLVSASSFSPSSPPFALASSSSFGGPSSPPFANLASSSSTVFGPSSSSFSHLASASSLSPSSSSHFPSSPPRSPSLSHFASSPPRTLSSSHFAASPSHSPSTSRFALTKIPSLPLASKLPGSAPGTPRSNKSNSAPNTPRTPRKGSLTGTDLVISVDTSGSLGTIFTQGVDIRRFVTRQLQNLPELRIGMLLHGDFRDYKSGVSILDLTSDVGKLCRFAEHVTPLPNSLQAGAYALALREARFMSWGGGRKFLVMIGAGVPRPPSYTKPHFNWRDELNYLANIGVKIYGAWYEQYEQSWPFYQELAEKTGCISVQFKDIQVIEDMLQAICLRELSQIRQTNFREELQRREIEVQKGGGEKVGPGGLQKGTRGRESEAQREVAKIEWLEQVTSLFPSLFLPDFDFENSTTNVQEAKSSAPWYNIAADEGRVEYFLDSETNSWTHADSSYFPSDDIPKMKFVLVGCRDVGKTFMLIRFANAYPHKGYYTTNIEVNGKTHQLALFDTTFTDTLYPLEFPQTDLFVICFSLVSPSSLLNVEKICHELSHAHIPFLLVGTKSDLRDVIPKGIPHVSTHQGQKFAKKTGAADYVECSAKTQFNVRFVFERAVTIVSTDYESKTKRKEKACEVM